MDNDIEIWKIKKLLKSLESFRGNGTSMISLILPPKYEELPLPSRQKTDSEPDSKSSVESILSKSEGVKTDNKSISNLEKEILENLKNNN